MIYFSHVADASIFIFCNNYRIPQKTTTAMNYTQKTQILEAYRVDFNCGDLDIDDYLVCNDIEADILVKESIIDSLWAFNPEFILSHTNCDMHYYDSTIKSLQNAQSELCEGANELVRLILGDNLDAFIEDAISTDGRGNFIALYDSEEIEFEFEDNTYYIYRTN